MSSTSGHLDSRTQSRDIPAKAELASARATTEKARMMALYGNSREVFCVSLIEMGRIGV